MRRGVIVERFVNVHGEPREGCERLRSGPGSEWAGRFAEIAVDRRTARKVEKQLLNAAETPPIAYEDFVKVDIRSGTIVAASPLRNARKPAFVLDIDFGPPIGIKRSSAQLTEHYTPPALVGRQVAAVVNIVPKRIAGIWSEVLVLGFAGTGEAIVLVAPERAVRNGARLF